MMNTVGLPKYKYSKNSLSIKEIKKKSLSFSFDKKFLYVPVTVWMSLPELLLALSNIVPTNHSGDCLFF